MSRHRFPGVAAGCLYSMGIAVTTGVMLVINGSLAMIFVRALVQSGSTLAAREDVAQFLLLALPVFMVLVEWKMIDYVWSRFA